tara:strand:+ start:193 stop:1257 length:1065 start_codon:yes stop_codon:yes gene_type:complete
MSKSLLDKLTLIIFTYNRHKYLKRTINYWSNYNLKLLILDGSNIKFNDPVLNNANIKYIHSTGSLYDRLLSSAKYIDTEFMILGADDEFYLPSALSSCVRFLIDNSSFSSCGGRAIGFGSDYKSKIFGKQIYLKLKNLNLDQNSPYERIFNHFSDYVPAHFYSVIRLNKWKKICSYVFQKRYNFAAAHELQVEFLTIVSGKSKIMPELMWMRNLEVKRIYKDLIELEINNWWLESNFHNEKLDFLRKMNEASKELISNINFNFDEKEISKLFELYIKKNFHEKFSKRNFFSRILDIISPQIREMKKKFIKKYKLKNNKYKSLVEEVRLIEKESVIVNYKELNYVINTLNQNYKN